MQAETLFRFSPVSSEVSWQFVSCQGQRFVCVWREQIVDEVLFFQQMEAINAFYDVLATHGGFIGEIRLELVAFVPPLSMVISGVLAIDKIWDVYVVFRTRFYHHR